MSKQNVAKQFQVPLLRDLYKMRFYIRSRDDFNQKLQDSQLFNPDQIKYLETRYETIVTPGKISGSFVTELAGLSLELEDQKELGKQLQGFSKYLASTLVDMKGSKSIKGRLQDQLTESVTPKGSKNTVKGTSKKRTKGRVKTRNPRHNKKGVASEPLALIKAINTELSSVVADKMDSPALVYRTGRFANSVRVIEVKTTAQGYPSIGYTYQRNPYQVFEMGVGKAPWATPERDPRKIIEQSIREIAAKFVQGRLYTRRL